MPNSTTSHGRFGIHGGQYIPETLMNAILELEEAYDRCREDPEFITELDRLEREYAGRPSLLYYAERDGQTARQSAPEPRGHRARQDDQAAGEQDEQGEHQERHDDDDGPDRG